MLRRLAFDRRLVLALWVLAAYLLLFYAAFRWGGARTTARYPGSD